MLLVPALTACAALQLVFWILFLIRFKAYRPSGGVEQPAVSVVVCAHDEEANLRELIPQLLTQEYSGFEVVVVNDRSNDGTFDFLLHLTAQEPRVSVVNVTYVPDHVNSKKYAVTLGIKAARNDWVLLTDADCRPASTRWLTSLMKETGPGVSIVLGYSGYRKLKGLLNSFIRFETQLTGIQYTGLALAGMPYMGVGRNLLYRKDLFLDNKGFGKHGRVTGGDDDLLVNRLAKPASTRVALSKDALVVSAPKTSWAAYFRQKVRHLAAGKKYKPGHRLVLALYSLTHIGFWVIATGMVLQGDFLPAVGIVVLVRWGMMIGAGRLFARRSGDPVEPLKWPVLDILYAIYYLIVGPVALMTKKIRWS